MQMTKEQEQIFNSRLKKYDDSYIVRKGIDGIYEIPCRNVGNIVPFGIDTLCCCQQFSSKRKTSHYIKKIPAYSEITQKGDSEIIFKFNEKYLDDIAPLVGARKRRVLSDEQREEYRIRAQLMRQKAA